MRIPLDAFEDFSSCRLVGMIEESGGIRWDAAMSAYNAVRGVSRASPAASEYLSLAGRAPGDVPTVPGAIGPSELKWGYM